MKKFIIMVLFFGVSFSVYATDKCTAKQCNELRASSDTSAVADEKLANCCKDNHPSKTEAKGSEAATDSLASKCADEAAKDASSPGTALGTKIEVEKN